jgi:hypothetical protein
VPKPTNRIRLMLAKKIVAPGLAAAIALAGGVAFAKAAPPLPIRGTIDAVTGSTLALTETSGAKISVTMAPGTTVTDVIPGSLADVKSGTYVGTAAIRQPNGEYRAMELQVFPDSMRGVGLGTRAWNLKPHSTMTNGTIGGLTHAGGTIGAMSGSGNLTLTVNDGSGKKTVLVPAGVPVVTYAPGSAAQLVPGAHVLLFPNAGSGASVTTSRINVGKNGLVPPM